MSSKSLDEYVRYVARTGDTVFPWHRIRHFMRQLLQTVGIITPSYSFSSSDNFGSPTLSYTLSFPILCTIYTSDTLIALIHNNLT